jgi:hypothetical protein
MSLASFTPERRILKFKKIELDLRGITTDDVTAILSRNLIQVQIAFESFEKIRSGVFTQAGLDAFLLQLVTGTPGLAAEVISICCDEPDQEAKARALPLVVQLSALQEIVSLTFEEAGGLKNWFATMTETLRNVLPASVIESLSSLRKNAAQPLSVSTGPSEEK